MLHTQQFLCVFVVCFVELEWKLSETSAVVTSLEEKPQPRMRTTVSFAGGRDQNDDSEDDDY